MFSRQGARKMLTTKEQLKKFETCKYFEGCDAPLCPLDEGIDKREWYRGEEICKNKRYNDTRMIFAQKEVSRERAKKADRDGDPKAYTRHDLVTL